MNSELSSLGGRFARAHLKELSAIRDQDFASSIPKVIDNAIVGYCLE